MLSSSQPAPSSSEPLSWNDPVNRIVALGSRRAAFLESHGLHTVGDVLLRSPLRFVDRRQSPPFSSFIPRALSQEVPDLQRRNVEITAIGQVESFGEKGYPPKRRLVVVLTDGTGYLQAVWFNSYRGLLEKLRPGLTLALTGRLTFYNGPQMVHPQVTILEISPVPHPRTGLIPVYPSAEEWVRVGLTPRFWERLVSRLLEVWDGSGPYPPPEVAQELQLGTLKEAMTALHQPASPDDHARALRCLKFSELFHHQLLMVMLRRRRRQNVGLRVAVRGELLERFLQNLPFKLSDGQRRVLNEIRDDLASGFPMHRLLQGEVGSGKTVVALAAAALVAEARRQTALMAPTELLARQHYRLALDWLVPAGLKPVLLTGSRGAEESRRALVAAAEGSADLVIGTQALFQTRVQFPRLGLVIIDEQQRFGVRQRSLLTGKGQYPHVLLMTATPIPRTLALAHYGDLDLSVLPPPPQTQRRVRTKVVHEIRRAAVFKYVRDRLLRGERGYLIYPVIEEGAAGLEAAQARFEPYRAVDFKGVPMALVHGRLPVESRIQAMEAFRRGEVRLLMATAVVEVGVDVPEASLMVVENAERFGLAQLHQLRGRIGRSGQPGLCVLMTPESPGTPGFERLRQLETCEDGLELAEVDLRLRGSGEPLGVRQTGSVKFHLADLATDYDILRQAHLAAERLAERYPRLEPFPDLRRHLREEYHSRPRVLLAG